MTFTAPIDAIRQPASSAGLSQKTFAKKTFPHLPEIVSSFRSALLQLSHRAARRAADLVILLLVLEVSQGFVEPTHPVVAVLFVWASTCGALTQLIAWRSGQPLTGAAPGSTHEWVLVSAVWWLAAACAGSHHLFPWHVPQMPFAVQAVGAGCLIFAVATPFLRIASLTRGIFAAYVRAIGSVLLTGSPVIAIVVGAWIVVTGRTAWRARVNQPAAAASRARYPLRGLGVVALAR